MTYWFELPLERDERQHMRMLLSDISTSCPVDIPQMGSLNAHEYLRSFTCDACFSLSRDGQEYVALHEKPHTVWVQDVVMPLEDGTVVFWKDSSCEEMGQPCCLYQSSATQVPISDLWKPRIAS